MAYLLAKKAHKGQVRKSEVDVEGNPLRYFEHPRRVAFSLFNEFGICSTDLICAALLHDVIEDADDVDLMSLLLPAVFCEDVTRLVRTVTKAPKAGYMERLNQAARDPALADALIIKAADRLDNLRTLPKPVDVKREDFANPAFHAAAVLVEQKNEAFREKQRTETIGVLMPVFERAMENVSHNYLYGYRDIVKAIRAVL
jgi:(p)ppGpp synthase/HD superfamily hydrolase